MRKIAVFILIVAFVGGCAGAARMPQPKTPAQSLIYVEGLYITAINTANDLAVKRVISVDTAKDIQERAHDADEYLDQAHALLDAGDASGALGQMALAEKILDVLIAELQEHEIKKRGGE